LFTTNGTFERIGVVSDIKKNLFFLKKKKALKMEAGIIPFWRS